MRPTLTAKKIKTGIIVSLAYISTLVSVACISSTLSIYFLQSQQFSAAYWSSSLARATLVPFRLLSPEQSFIRLWDDALTLVQLSPDILQQATSFQSTLAGKPTTDAFSPAQAQTILGQTSRTTTKMMHNLSDWRGVKRIVIGKWLNQEQVEQYGHTALWLQELASAALQEYSFSVHTPDPRRYLIMLQNSTELRPSGGFLGSYAEIALTNGKIQHFEVQDIYVPDGQLTGHVEPPTPIQAAFQHGFWKLRDANWHPDFEHSANTIEWFYEHATGKNVDGIIAVNYSAIESLFAIIGPLYLPDYQLELTAENLYPFLQNQVESDFFPGSTKKRDLLASVTRQVILALVDTSLDQRAEILRRGHMLSNQREIQVHMDEQSSQEKFHTLSLTGKLLQPDCGPDCTPLQYSVFEANLGANKSNCCVERNIEISLHPEATTLDSQIRLTYLHPPADPLIQERTGTYLSFVRLYLPRSTTVENIAVDSIPYSQFMERSVANGEFSSITPTQYSLTDVGELTELGFWIRVPQQESRSIQITLAHPPLLTSRGQLFFQKQSGTRDFFNHLKVEMNNQTLIDQQISEDQYISL